MPRSIPCNLKAVVCTLWIKIIERAAFVGVVITPGQTRRQKRVLFIVSLFVFFRLSDYLFTAARYAAMKERRVEQIYVRPDKHEEKKEKS